MINIEDLQLENDYMKYYGHFNLKDEYEYKCRFNKKTKRNNSS